MYNTDWQYRLAIQIGNTDLISSNTLAVTVQNNFICTAITPNISTSMEFDITLNRRQLNKIVFDTARIDSIPLGKADGYSIFLHELGHGHSLEHLSDSTKIMYYTASGKSISSAKRKIRLYQDASAKSAGDYIVKQAQDSLRFYDCGHRPMHLIYPVKCTPFHSNVSNIADISNYLNVSPNPFKDEMRLHFNSEHSSLFTVKAYNMFGQIIYTSIVNNDNSDYIINTSQWSHGIYILNVQNGNMFFSYKIIKY